MKIKYLDYFIFFSLALVLFCEIYLLALPVWFDILLTIFILIIFKDKVQIFFTIILISILIIFFIVFIPNGKDSEYYYRPHEKFSRDKSYETNVNYEMSASHGDLYQMAIMANTDIKDLNEKKKIRFITDKYGYRNNQISIEDSEIILVGDSFIVGNGNTQNDIPAEQLSRLSGLKIASIAYPGSPELYEDLISNLIHKDKIKKKYLIFYFEGNDFTENKTNKTNFYNLIRKEYFSLEIKKDKILNNLYKNKKSILRKIRKNSHFINKKFLYIDGISNVKIKKIGKKNLIFLKEYSSRKNETHIIKDKIILSNVIGIFFVPTKARTYSRYLNQKLDNNNFEYLRNEYGRFKIPVINLSETFIQNASKYLAQDKYLYWRDDTHWNSIGIKIAMKCVNDFINTNEYKKYTFKCRKFD